MKADKLKKENRMKCHFVSNTHWDRQWRFSMQRTRYMLVQYLDMLLDIFEKEPAYIDSQTIPLQDYLEIRPEKTERIKAGIAPKKLVGPWYTLPIEKLTDLYKAYGGFTPEAQRQKALQDLDNEAWRMEDSITQDEMYKREADLLRP
jgi:hypothetical protein